MSQDIELDTNALEALASDLASVIAEFENAKSNADETATATGADDLADRVRHFAGSWRIRRGKMVDDVKSLQQIIAQIAETMTQVDVDLAKALEEGAENPPPARDYGRERAV